MLNALIDEFEIELINEHDHRHWGFATEEEWDACWDKIAKEYDGEFYKQLLCYMRGEPNSIMPGTNGFGKAEIAKCLFARDPSWIGQGRRDELLKTLQVLAAQPAIRTLN
jgi:hypothetical protein